MVLADVPYFRGLRNAQPYCGIALTRMAEADLCTPRSASDSSSVFRQGAWAA